MKITNENAIFLDHILDPYVRGELMFVLISGFKRNQSFTGKAVICPDNPGYFVIHPFLRHLVIKNINRSFDKSKPIGVFKKEIKSDES